MLSKVHFLGAIVLTGALAVTAHAAADIYKCDKYKSKAVAKLFATAMSCLTKGFADAPDFDTNGCLDDAEQKCVDRFDAADLKYGAECINNGTGPDRCSETRSSASGIYNNL